MRGIQMFRVEGFRRRVGDWGSKGNSWGLGFGVMIWV